MREGVVETFRAGGIVELVDSMVEGAAGMGSDVLVVDGRRSVTGAQVAELLAGVPAGFVASGMARGELALVGVRPGFDALVVVLGVARAGGRLAFVDPGADPAAARRRLEVDPPAWVVAEGLLYLATAPTPLRGYLRRRGFALPSLGRIDARHVRVGRRLPGMPRARSLAQLADAGGTAREALPELDPAAVVVEGAAGAQSARQLVDGIVELLDLVGGVGDDAILLGSDLRTLAIGISSGRPVHVATTTGRCDRFLDEVERSGATHVLALPVDPERLVRYCEGRGRRLPDTLRVIVLPADPEADAAVTAVVEQLRSHGPPELRVLAEGRPDATAPARLDRHE